MEKIVFGGDAFGGEGGEGECFFGRYLEYAMGGC
jgi:hypothetical protein